MINDFIIGLINFFDSIFEFLFSDLLQKFLSIFDTVLQYSDEFSVYLGGIYYVLGKPLVIFLVSSAIIIILIRLVFAIINVVSQFIP